MHARNDLERYYLLRSRANGRSHGTSTWIGLALACFDSILPCIFLSPLHWCEGGTSWSGETGWVSSCLSSCAHRLLGLFSFDDSWDGTPPAWLGRWEVRCSVIPDVDRAGRWAGTQERSGMLCGILSVACIVFCCITLQRGVGESITRSGVE